MRDFSDRQARVKERLARLSPEARRELDEWWAEALVDVEGWRPPLVSDGGDVADLAKVLDPEIWAAELDEQATVGSRYLWHERRRVSELHAKRALAAGWRPPLPEGDLATLISVVGALIDEHFGDDDHPAQSRAAAKAILDAGYLDKTGAVGPREPVATTLRRIIQDLENEAVFRDPVRVIGAYEERSVDDIVGARTLREYADRLRSHPVLTGEPGKDPLPEGETQWSVREEDVPGWYYGPTTDEADAREEAACRPGNTLGKREVWYGPWTEVQR